MWFKNKYFRIIRCGYICIIQAIEECVFRICPPQKADVFLYTVWYFPDIVNSLGSFYLQIRRRRTPGCGWGWPLGLILRKRLLSLEDAAFTWALLEMAMQSCRLADPTTCHSTWCSELFQPCRWVPTKEVWGAARWRGARTHTLWAQLRHVCFLSSAS